MKRYDAKKSVCFFLRTVCACIALAVTAAFVGCKQNVNNGTETPAVKKFTVTFSVEGGNGSIEAKVDDKVISTGAKIEKDKTIVFTATPAPNYAVDGWTLNGAAVSGNATNTYSHTVTAEADIKVRFKSSQTQPDPTSPVVEKYAVTFSADAHGSLTAKVDGNTIDNGAKVEKDKTVTFTATPASGYAVDTWDIEGGVFEAGTGTPGNGTAKVTITANTTVRVSFTLTSDLQMRLDQIMKTIPSETNDDIQLKSSIPGYEITWKSSDANILKVESSGVGRITYDLIDRKVELTAEIEDKATQNKETKTKTVTVNALKRWKCHGNQGSEILEFEGDKLTITDMHGRPVTVYRVQIDGTAKTIKAGPEQATYDGVLMTPEEVNKKLIDFIEKTNITPICSLLLLLEKPSVTLKDILQASHGMGGGPKTEEEAFTLIARSNPGLSYEAFLQKSEEEQTTLIKSVLENSKKEVYEICFISPETMPLAQALPKIREFTRAQIQAFYSERLKAPVTYTYRIEKDTLSTHAVYDPNISWHLQVGRYEYTDTSSTSVKKVFLYKESMLTMGSRISIDIDDWSFGLRYKDSPSFPAKANGLREHSGKEITVNKVIDRGDGTIDVDISGDIRFSGKLTFRGNSISSIEFNFEG